MRRRIESTKRRIAAGQTAAQPKMILPVLFLVGNAANPEHAAAIAELSQLGEVRAFPRLEQAVDDLGPGRPEPDLIVLLQDRGGQFPLSEVERLRRAAPLARWVSVLGAWSDGEMRTGRPLAGTRRLPWLAAAGQFARWQKLGNSRAAAAWSRPETTSEEEDALSANPVSDRPAPNGRLAIVFAPVVESGEILVDALTADGWSCDLARSLADSPPANADLVVADLSSTDFDPHAASSLVDWADGVPVIAVRSFWRPHEAAVAHECGMRAILGKPWRLAALYWTANVVATH